MNNKSIFKVILLVVSVLLFWYIEIFFISPLITVNKPTQILINMASFPFLLMFTVHMVIKIWAKNDK